MVTRIALSRYYMHTPCAVDIIAMYYCKINHGNLSDKALTTGYSVPYMQLRAFGIGILSFSLRSPCTFVFIP